MPRLTWDNIGERLFETGIQKGVVYPLDETNKYTGGEAWNGLVSIAESPSGAEPTALWANDTKYGELLSTEEFAGTIEAYTYPDAFAKCDGSAELTTGVRVRQQVRKTFGLTYRSGLANDTEGVEYGYIIHLVYGCKASPSEKTNSTINDSPEANTMSWEFTTTPVSVTGHKPTSHIEIDSTKVDATKLKALEDILYGSDSEEARLPLPDEVKTILESAA
jgi:hypothetical protein